MNDFQLDERLQNDCILLQECNEYLLLLMNNSLVPWFILVPKTTVKELYELPAPLRQIVESKIDLFSRFILQQFEMSKINVAAIGNVVSQLHIHVIGRSPSDFCWPDVVWGRPERKPYKPNEIEQIKQRVCESLNLK